MHSCIIGCIVFANNLCDMQKHNFPFQIGTYTISISAKAMNKPFYVVAESFKFARFYPLNQRDVPNEFKVRKLQLIIYSSASDLVGRSDPWSKNWWAIF